MQNLRTNNYPPHPPLSAFRHSQSQSSKPYTLSSLTSARSITRPNQAQQQSSSNYSRASENLLKSVQKKKKDSQQMTVTRHPTQDQHSEVKPPRQHRQTHHHQFEDKENQQEESSELLNTKQGQSLSKHLLHQYQESSAISNHKSAIKSGFTSSAQQTYLLSAQKYQNEIEDILEKPSSQKPKVKTNYPTYQHQVSQQEEQERLMAQCASESQISNEYANPTVMTQTKMYERSVHLSASKNGRALSIYKDSQVLQTGDRSKLLNKPRESIGFSAKRLGPCGRVGKKLEVHDDNTQTYNTRITYSEQQANQYQNLRDQLRLQDFTEEKSTTLRPTQSPVRNTYQENNISVDVHSTSPMSATSNGETCLQKHAKENQKSCKVLNPFSSLPSQNPRGEWDYSTIQSAASSVQQKNAPNNAIGKRNHNQSVSSSLNQRAIAGLQSAINQANTVVEDLKVNSSESKREKQTPNQKTQKHFSSTKQVLQGCKPAPQNSKDFSSTQIAPRPQTSNALNAKHTHAIKNSTSSSIFGATANSGSNMAATQSLANGLQRQQSAYQVREQLQRQPSFGNQSSIHYKDSKTLERTVDRNQSKNQGLPSHGSRGGGSKLSVCFLPNRTSACSQLGNLNHSQVPKVQDKPQAKKISDDSDQETIDSQDMSSIIQDLKSLEKQTSSSGIAHSHRKKSNHQTSSRVLAQIPQTLQSFDRKDDVLNLHLQSSESLNKELFSFNDGLFSVQSQQMSQKDLKSKDLVYKAAKQLTKNLKPLDPLTLIQGLQSVANCGGMSFRSNSSGGRQRARWDLSGGKSTLQNSFRKNSDCDSVYGTNKNDEKLLKVNKSPVDREGVLKMNFENDTCTKQYEQLQEQYQAIKQQLKHFKQLKGSSHTQQPQIKQQSVTSNQLLNQLKIDQSKISKAQEGKDQDQLEFATLVTEQNFYTQNQMSSEAEDLNESLRDSNYSQEADAESQDDDFGDKLKMLKKPKHKSATIAKTKAASGKQNGLQRAEHGLILKTNIKQSKHCDQQLLSEKAQNQQTDQSRRLKYFEDQDQSQDFVMLKRKLVDDIQNLDQVSTPHEISTREISRLSQGKTNTQNKKIVAANDFANTHSGLQSQLQMGLRKLSETSSQLDNKLYRNTKTKASKDFRDREQADPKNSKSQGQKQTAKAAANSQVSFVVVESQDERAQEFKQDKKPLKSKHQQASRLVDKRQSASSCNSNGKHDFKFNRERNSKGEEFDSDCSSCKRANQRPHNEKSQVLEQKQRRKNNCHDESVVERITHRATKEKQTRQDRSFSQRENSQNLKSSLKQSSRDQGLRSESRKDRNEATSKRLRSSTRQDQTLLSSKRKDVSSSRQDHTPTARVKSKSKRRHNPSSASTVNPWLPSGYKQGLEAASINILQQQLALAQSLQAPSLFQAQMLQPLLIPNQAAYLGMPPLLPHPVLQTKVSTQQPQTIKNPSIISSFPISKMHSPSSTTATLQLSLTKNAALHSQTNSIQNQKQHFKGQNSQVYQQVPHSAQNFNKYQAHSNNNNVEPFEFKSFEQHQEQIEAIESLILQAKERLYTNIISNSSQNCKFNSGQKDSSHLNSSTLNSTRLRSNIIQRQIIDMNIEREDPMSCQDEIESKNQEMNHFINQSLSISKQHPHSQNQKHSQYPPQNSSRNQQRANAECYNSNHSESSRMQDRNLQGSRNNQEQRSIFTTQNSNQAKRNIPQAYSNLEDRADCIDEGQEPQRSNNTRRYGNPDDKPSSKVNQQRYQNQRDYCAKDTDQFDYSQNHPINFEKRQQSSKLQSNRVSDRAREKQRMIDAVVSQFGNEEEDSTQKRPKQGQAKLQRREEGENNSQDQDENELMIWIDFDESNKSNVKRKQEQLSQRMKGGQSRQTSEAITLDKTQAATSKNQKGISKQETDFTQVVQAKTQACQQKESGWVMDFTEKPTSPAQNQQAQQIAEAFKNRLLNMNKKFKKNSDDQNCDGESQQAKKKEYTKVELQERKKELQKEAREKIKQKAAADHQSSSQGQTKGSAPQSKIAQHASSEPGAVNNNSAIPPVNLLSRLSSGQRAEVTKKDMIRLTSKNYEQLPEIQQRKKDSTKRDELLKRLQQAKQLDSDRRQKAVSKQRQSTQRSNQGDMNADKSVQDKSNAAL